MSFINLIKIFGWIILFILYYFLVIALKKTFKSNIDRSDIMGFITAVLFACTIFFFIFSFAYHD